MSALEELAKPVADLVWLVEIDAARIDAGDDEQGQPKLVVETLRMASRAFITDPVLDSPAETPIEGRFTPSFDISWELSANADTGFSPMPDFQVGQLEIENGDGALDGWLDLYAVQGREVRVSAAAWPDVLGARVAPGGDVFPWLDGAGGHTTWTDSTSGGAPGLLWADSAGRGRAVGALATFRRLFRGRVSSWSFSGGRIAVRVEPDARRLDEPVQVATYDGKGDLGGISQLAGRAKPRVLGVRHGVEPTLIDPLLLIYQANDGAMHGFSDVRDKGISLALVKDYDSYALLKAAVQQSLTSDQDGYDIGIGQYATCLVEGVFRLGGPADGRVVCDVQGSSFAEAIEQPWADGTSWADGAGWTTLGFQQTVEVPWADGTFWSDLVGWTTQGAPPYFSGARHLAQRLLVDDCGFDAGEVDSEGIDHLNGRDPDGSLDPSSGLNFPSGGSTTGRDALAKLFQTAGVIGFQDRDGVWRVRYVEIPAGPADIVLDESMLVDDSLERLDLSWPAPWATWKAAWDRNSTPMTASDLAGGDAPDSFVDPNIRAFSLRATAYAQADDPTLALLYPQKRVATLETELSDESDAVLRAAQMRALYGGGQALYRARWEGVMGRIGFMDAVTVRVPRLGMRAGRTFLVVGLTESAPNRQTQTILFGGGFATAAKPVPAVFIASAPDKVAISATAAVAVSFGVTLSAAGDLDAVVLWGLGGLAASELQTALSGTLTIPAGQTAATLPVVFGPQSLTGVKTATLTIRPQSGAAAGSPLSVSFSLVALAVETLRSVPQRDWAFGAKPSVTTAAQRFGPFPQPAVQVKNFSNRTVFVRADDGAAADDAGSDPLAAGTARTYAIGSADDKVSILAAAAITSGAVYLMPVTLGTASPLAAFISAGFGSVTPSASTTVNAQATVALSAAAQAPASVTWTVTGLASGDVVGALTGSVTVPAGQASAAIGLTFAAQVLASNKSATLTLSAPTGCTLGNPSALDFTLVANQASVPAASLASGPGAVSVRTSTTATATAVVALSATAPAPASVTWTITGLASGDVAGGALTGTLTVPAQATSATLTLTFAAQTLAADKPATFTLSAPSGCVLGTPTSAAFSLLKNNNPVVTQVPYPASTTWRQLALSGSATSLGVGADQWPMTRTPTDTLLAAWGDGNGWAGSAARSFLGVTEISGAPASLTGVDRYMSGSASGTPNRKPNAILHVGGSTVILWHVNQTLDSRAGTYVALSTNGGTTWTFHETTAQRIFSTAGSPPLQVVGALQLGPGYGAAGTGIDTNYAYLSLNTTGNLSNPFVGTNGKVWLCRVKFRGGTDTTTNLWTPAKYSFFNGLDGSGNPLWTADGGTLDTTKYLYYDPAGMGKHFIWGWNEANARFFAGVTPTASQIAVHEAATPWGAAWRQLYYGAGSDPQWTAIFTAQVPGSWTTTSQLWLAVSGNPPDSLDVQSAALVAP